VVISGGMSVVIFILGATWVVTEVEVGAGLLPQPAAINNALATARLGIIVRMNPIFIGAS
jgi:hypothetical protein